MRYFLFGVYTWTGEGYYQIIVRGDSRVDAYENLIFLPEEELPSYLLNFYEQNVEFERELFQEEAENSGLDII